MRTSSSDRVALYLVLSIFVTLLLYYVVPYGRTIAYPLVLLSTLAHELGHGIAAVVFGGDFVRFVLYDNGAGVAMTRSSTTVQRAMILAGGLLGPAFVAALGFRLGRKPARAKATLLITGICLVLVCIWVVRNVFGFVFVALTAFAFILIARRASAAVCQFTTLFVATQLALSVFSRADYLFTPSAEIGGGKKMPSDVGQLSDLLFLPYWFWGIVCGALSLFVLMWGLKTALPAVKKS